MYKPKKKQTAGKSSAPAKIILFGEHFVVYGRPAILASINRRIGVIAKRLANQKIVINSDIGGSASYSNGNFELLKGNADSKVFLDPIYKSITSVVEQRNKKEIGIQVDIKSEIPYGMGLGSSAASCVATIAAVDSLFHKPDKKWVCQNAIEAERTIHRNSSGADCYVSTYGGLMHYNKLDGFSEIKSKKKLSFIVADTDITHSTGSLVASVQKFIVDNDLLFNNLADQAEEICQSAADALTLADKEKIGRLMNENHALLKQIGVSHEKIERLVEICNGAGALGSKLTGAGGGGAVIALAHDSKDVRNILSKIKKNGYNCFDAEIDHEGLIVR